MCLVWQRQKSGTVYFFFFIAQVQNVCRVIKAMPHWPQHLAWNWLIAIQKHFLAKWKENKGKYNVVGQSWAIKFPIKTCVESVSYLSNCFLSCTVESSHGIAFIMRFLDKASQSTTDWRGDFIAFHISDRKKMEECVWTLWVMHQKV